MNIQIYGSNKCFDTQKAQRYFKERAITYQYIDILKFGLSKGELNSVKAAVDLEALINSASKAYTQLNMHRISAANSSREQILLDNPKLYSTPIVRNGRQATVGYRPEVWSLWE